jgi:hypothetical protein
MSDVSLAVSENAFKALFNKITPTPTMPFDGSTSLGPIWIGVEAAIHIVKAADIDFEDTDTFLVSELDIAWDKLILRLGFDIPTVTVGKVCLFRMPDDAPFLAGECLAEFPGADLFTAEPDIGPIKINLNAIITYVVSEFSGRYKIRLENRSGKLVLLAEAQATDIDPISINDTFGNLPTILQAAIAAAAASYVKANPPAWLIDAGLGLLGFPSITELLLDLLDIEDDVEEWLMDVLNEPIGLDNFVYQCILNAVLDKPIFEIPDPYEFIPKQTVSLAKFGGFADPQPPGPTVELEAPRADLLNPNARFDDDMLHVTFDFAL